MDQPLNQLKIHTLQVTSENWLTVIKQPLHERSHFRKGERELQIGQVIASFLGIPINEDEYFQQLYEYVYIHGLRLLSMDVLGNGEQLSRKSTQTTFQKPNDQVQTAIQFVVLLEKENILLTSENPLLSTRIKEAYLETVQLFETNEERGLENPDFYIVMEDIIKWSFYHLEDLLHEADPLQKMPGFLWYGGFKKNHQYFLSFLKKLGCDLILFNPGGEDVFSLIETEHVQTLVHTFSEKKPPESFPSERRKLMETPAYRATREIESILIHEGSGLYKPWQLRDYTPFSITLKTTYDELFLLAREKAMIRPNFDVIKGNVKIPVLFSKINGVSKNRREYWNRLHSLMGQKNTLLIKSFPLTLGANNDFRFHYRSAIGKDGLLDPIKMINSHYWKYKHMPTGFQKGLGVAIRNLCSTPVLKQHNHEKLEDVKIYLFTQAMQVPDVILKMLQKFDYSQEVPKVIFYNNEMNGTITRPDAALLLLLNQFGIDLVIYNPSGYNDIEVFIDGKAFDSHWLDDIVYDQEFKEPSFLKKILFKEIFKNLRGER